MTNQLIDFAEYKRLRDNDTIEENEYKKLQQQENVGELYSRLLRLVEETANVVFALEIGVKRELAKAAGNDEITDHKVLALLTRSYERYSWKLHSQLQYMTNAALRKSHM